ncbi:hypothetical protein CTAYLR_006950, partial [Chrysophaeum taylorii]
TGSSHFIKERQPFGEWAIWWLCASACGGRRDVVESRPVHEYEHQDSELEQVWTKIQRRRRDGRAEAELAFDPIRSPSYVETVPSEPTFEKFSPVPNEKRATLGDDGKQAKSKVPRTTRPFSPVLSRVVLRTSPESPRLGVSIDDFEIGECVGRGSYSLVVVAVKRTEPHRGRVFAVKMIEKVDANVERRARKERIIMARLRHCAFTLHCRYGFQDQETRYIATDFYAGGSLETQLEREGCFARERAVFHAAEILLALRHMHANTICHRDIKLSNVLVDARGHVVVGDFGFARTEIEPGRASMRTFCGTIEYLAPEVLRGDAYGLEVDWWAFGVVIYQMLCGRTPFYHPSPRQMFAWILRAPPPADDERCPVEALLTVGDLLVKRAKDRRGYGDKGADSVMKTPLFARVDFPKLEAKLIDPPFAVALLSSCVDRDDGDHLFFGFEEEEEEEEDDEAPGRRRRRRRRVEEGDRSDSDCPRKSCEAFRCAFRNASRACVEEQPLQEDGEKVVRVYIYSELSPSLYDVGWRPSGEWDCEEPVTGNADDVIDQVFGTFGVTKHATCPVVPGEAWRTMFASQQWRASEMLLFRAATSLRCPREFDPGRADLFLVPVLPASKSTTQWNAACTHADASERGLLRELKYFNLRTAHRHLLVVGKGLANAKECEWFLEPHTLLRRAQRFAYSARVILPKDDYDARRAKPRYGPAHLPYVPSSAAALDRALPRDAELREELEIAPNLVSIPYPSSIHASRDTNPRGAPWRVRPLAERDILMSFQGTLPKEKAVRIGENGTLLQDKHYGASVRERIVEICANLPQSICLFDNLDPEKHYHYRRVASPPGECFDHLGRRGFRPESLERVKGRSVFCLEPMGDSPYRKSIWDSLAVGCIPVVFSLYAEITAPWHWGSWRNDSRVYIPEQLLFEDDFDIVHHLASIPNATVRRMQETIASNNHRIQFAIDDLPYDAYETLVRRAAAEASHFEATYPHRLKHHHQAETGQWLDVRTS